MAAPPFYGWRVVYGAMAIAFIAWSFALYGASVYVTVISEVHGWSMGTVSSALTGSFLINAFVIGFVGSWIGRHGPRLVMTLGACFLASGIAGLGQANTLWQMALSFVALGLGWSCLSTIAISSTVAPWFERYQGKAISTALLGASLGGMFGVPITLFLVTQLGLSTALALIAGIVLVTVIPISLLILRKDPQSIGMLPDGIPTAVTKTNLSGRVWSRREALATYALRSIILTFGLALMVQVGFLSQQVKLLQSFLSPTLTGLTVLTSGSLAFLGRVVLTRIADKVNVRITSALVLWISALGLSIAAFAQSPVWLILGVLLFGVNVGNLTTLPALIVRREFGSVSFGKVFGITGTFMQLLTALGPALFGLLHDLSDSYTLPIFLAACLMLTGSFLIAKGQWRGQHPSR